MQTISSEYSYYDLGSSHRGSRCLSTFNNYKYCRYTMASLLGLVLPVLLLSFPQTQTTQQQLNRGE